MTLEEELHVIIGRVNALHAAVTTIAAYLPKDVAATTAVGMREAAERVHADMLSLPINDLHINECSRVLNELAMVLESNAKATNAS